MSKVFVVHSQEDRDSAVRLEEALNRHGCLTSRPPLDLERDANWPGTLGRQVSACDLIVLLWSRSSSECPSVALAWTTALALHRGIVTCILDKTSLLPALQLYPIRSFEAFEDAVTAILEVAHRTTADGTAPASDVEATAAVAMPGPHLAGQPAAAPRGSEAPTAGYALPSIPDSPSGPAAPEHASSAGATVAAPSHAEPQARASEAVSGPDTLAVQQQVGSRYRLVRMLGRGGMGAVYQAHDNELRRPVALKVLLPDVAANEAMLERFKREIHISSTVTHRNVLRVFDLGEGPGTKFLTMEFIEGENLAEMMKREGRLPIDLVIRILRQVCLGLGAAHEQGVLHRDLKPANVMISHDDRVLLTDFGIAKSLEQTGMTQAGEIMGTPHYMSPEQVKGEPIDARSDIYSLGVMLYEMATGQVPYSGHSIYEVMIQRVQKDPRPAVELNPDIPPFLQHIIQRCMAMKKEDRYGSTAELLADLDQSLQTGVTPPMPTPSLRRRLQSLRSVPVRTILLVLTAALVVSIAWWFWRGARGSPGGGPVGQAQQAPLSVLVADFQNRTGDSMFDGTLEETLGIGLEGASFITTFNRGQARKITGQIQEGRQKLNLQTARLVAQREGISVVVDGGVQETGDSYEISASAIDALTGKALATGTVTAAKKADVLASVAKLSSRIRETLGDKTPESARLAAGETFTASTLEAAHDYAQAQELQGLGKWEEAIPEYESAIRVDPDLGRAYAGMAVMYRNLGRREEAEKYYKMAMVRIDRMSERERHRTRGGYFVTVGDHQKAIEEFAALVSEYPADFVGHSNLALSNFLAGNMSKAMEEGRRAVAIYPRNIVMRTNLALYALYAGDFAAAKKEARDILAVNRSYGSVYVCLALAQLAQGHPEEAVRAYDQLKALDAGGASIAAMGLADKAIYEGRLNDAVSILGEGIRSDRTNKDDSAAERKEAVLAMVRLKLGQSREALTRADFTAAVTSQPSVLFELALVYLEAGRADRAHELAAGLAKRLQAGPQAYAKLIEGEASLRKHNTLEALRQFQEAQKLADTWLGRLALGRAYLEAEGYTEAYAEFEKCMKRRGEATAVFLDDIPTFHYYPPLLYYIGRAQQGLGSAAAADSYRSFLQIKQKSDPDPLVEDARHRLSKF
jgi:tetratricopeptide (TPR) repeat protein/predicted Ser/Thr protein kinase